MVPSDRRAAALASPASTVESYEPTLDRSARPGLAPDELITQKLATGLTAQPLEPRAFPGSRVGRFYVLRKLGEGGMGEVFAAYDEALDRRVAVKLLRRTNEGDKEAKLRLLREAQALAQLSHPHVVTVYEVGELEGWIFIAMEYVDGLVLKEWQEAPERTPHELLRAYRHAGRGLQAAHAVGLVHRDFKPTNAIMGRDGRVRVLDFGLAYSAGSEAVAASSVLHTRLTQPGGIMGTPAYMAPEQLLGHPADARSDQFSFCVALFEALYRHHPFPFAETGNILSAMLAAQAPAPPHGSAVPRRLHEMLARGLSRAPDQRWPDMRTLLKALESVPEAERPAEARHRLIVSGLFVLIVSGVLIRAIAGGAATPMNSPAILLLITVTLALLVCCATLVFRKSLMQSQFHRYMVLLTLLILVIMSISRGLGLMHGDSSAEIIVRDLLVITTAAASAILFLPKPPAIALLPLVICLLGAVIFSMDPSLGARAEAVVFNAAGLSISVVWHHISKLGRVPWSKGQNVVLGAPPAAREPR